MERDEAYKRNLDPGRKVACVGYNGMISDEDARKIKEEATTQVQLNLQQLAVSVRFY